MWCRNAVINVFIVVAVVSGSSDKADAKGIIEGILESWSVGSASDKAAILRSAATAAGGAAQANIGAINYYSQQAKEAKANGIQSATCGITSFFCSYADAAVKVGVAAGRETNIVDRMQSMDFRSEEFAQQYKLLDEQRAENRKEIAKALPDRSVDVIAEQTPVLDAIFAMGGAISSVKDMFIGSGEAKRTTDIVSGHDASSESDRNTYVQPQPSVDNQNNNGGVYSWRVISMDFVIDGRLQNTNIPDEIKECVTETNSIDPLEILKEIGRISNHGDGTYEKCSAPSYRKVSASEANGSVRCTAEVRNGTDGPDRNYLLPPKVVIGQLNTEIQESVQISGASKFSYGSEITTIGRINNTTSMSSTKNKSLILTVYEICK